MADKALMSVVQREVVFYEDVITAVQVEINNQPRILIPLRPICDHLELNWSGQLQRIRRDPILSSELASVYVTHREPGRSDEMTETEATREMICLPLDYLNGWLFGVNPNRVKESIRDRLLRYQRDCFRVLFEAFQDGQLTGDHDFKQLVESDTPAAQAYKMAVAVMKIARQQLVLESRLDEHTVQLGKHEQRLEEIEASLGDPNRYITPDQAMQLSQAVKAVALAIGKKTKRNEHGGVYGELYRRYRIPGYKVLPAYRFEDAMNWLTEWYRSVTDSTDEDLPF
jgi:hypothetical protein